MEIKYLGPSPFVNVGEYGPHYKDKIEDYPKEVGEELLATAKKQQFEAVSGKPDSDKAKEKAEAEAKAEADAKAEAKAKADAEKKAKAAAAAEAKAAKEAEAKAKADAKKKA